MNGQRTGITICQRGTRTIALQNQPAPGTRLDIASVPNLRDIGGYTTQDGSLVRRGVAYRSNQLNPVAPDDMKKLAALGLKNDFDLRAAGEREAKPDQLPAGVKNVWLNVPHSVWRHWIAVPPHFQTALD
jgi:hypothetical protein